jgi:lipopolysaccharide/colanic/teichoic acid biosynthesis glycosyltransferase
VAEGDRRSAEVDDRRNSAVEDNEGVAANQGYVHGGTRMMKRAMDIVGGIFLSVLVTPVILLIALGSALSMRSWPFFIQDRVGLDGRKFRMVKIRTMPPTTPAYADRHAVQTVRLTSFCAFLRRNHLDELPQFYHVVQGRMSLVGPRPEMPQVHEGMDPEFAACRTSVLPGCTGLWQATDGIRQMVYVVPEYDRAYVENASLRLDLWVMWRTLMMLNPFSGTKTLDEVPQWAIRQPERRPAQVINLRRESVDLRVHELDDDLAFDA